MEARLMVSLSWTKLPTFVALIIVLNLVRASMVDAASGHIFTGTVRDSSGMPIAGAAVTVSNLALSRRTTVFTSASGRYELPPFMDGSYLLSVRRSGYKDLRDRDLTFSGDSTPLELKMTAETDPNELAWSLPANRWLPLVLAQLSSNTHREEFIRQCGYCHQQGSWATRVQRSNDDWQAIFDRMARMGGRISPGLRAELPEALNRAYDDGNYLHSLAEPEFIGEPAPSDAAKSIITEWSVGTSSSMLHDVAVAPDGSVWAVDTNADRLYRLDPSSDELKSYDIPSGDSPVGGVFRFSGQLQTPGTNARLAPHSLQFAPDGTIWITLCLGNKLAHFDPRTNRWTIHELSDGLYPHTLRIDRKGRVWYTLAVSNQLGMIEPASGQMHTYNLPAQDFRQAITLRLLPTLLKAADRFHVSLPDPTSTAPGPDPYGIDIAPDGGIWFSQLNAQRIGRLDPDSGAIKMVNTPFSGPRRLRFDSKGDLWIAGFSADLVARYSPAIGAFKTYRLPTGGVDTPYAVNVDRRSDTVWICGTASDTLVSFDPHHERFTIYPLPTRVTYTREIDFGRDGAVWTSSSSSPAWHIEAPFPTIIRVEPGK
jgi:virginiamycin B lyase